MNSKIQLIDKYIKNLSIDNWISLGALIVALISLCFAIKAFYRTSQKLHVSIDDFAVWHNQPSSNKEFVFNLLIRNPHNMPLTIYDIELVNNGKSYQQDERVKQNLYLAPNDADKFCVVYYVDNTASETKSTLIIKTSAKNIKCRLLHSVQSNNRENDSNTTHANRK